MLTANIIEFIEGDIYSYVFVKGWGDIDLNAVAKAYNEYMGGGYSVGDLSTGRQVYGAKLQTAFSRGEGWAYEFREYTEPGRGRFKCTIVERK